MKCPHCGREIDLWASIVPDRQEKPPETVRSSAFLGEHLKKKNRNLRRWTEHGKGKA